jgi:bifunctional non-homologous end joining protein LigD
MAIRARTAVLDGEVVAINPSGQPSFQVLQNRGKLPAGYQLVFYVFDLLFLNGKPLTGLSLIEPRSALPDLLAGSGVRFSSPLEGGLQVILKAVLRHNLEGIAAKRKDSTYQSGRPALPGRSCRSNRSRNL